MMGDVGADEVPGDAEARGLAMLAETGAAIAAGVAQRVPGWVVAQVTRLIDAWGRADDAARAEAIGAAPAAGAAAAARIGAALSDLFARDPADQRATPLEIVRSVYREPTEVLMAAGIPPVVRDAFDERTRPDDRYDLAPHTLGDLGDPELAPLHLAWGVAKATVLRARAGD
jgi:hypothetical protein